MSYSSADVTYMARAIQLAGRGIFTTQPNPRVGCVLVSDNCIIGEGYHRQAGGPHAEINALQQAQQQAAEKIRGATAYVSLEPCSHQGKTPPCADALIAAGVGRVVCAMRDPNPLVAGKGLARLEQAGINVAVGLLQTDAEALNPGFIKRMRTGLPYVRVKLAMSLDGRTAMASGESQWITGAEARADVQKLRARSSVVLSGSGTVLADNPSMNVRLSSMDAGTGDILPHQPLRAIIDSELKVPAGSKIFQQPGQTIIFTRHSTEQEYTAKGFSAEQLVFIPEKATKLDLQAIMLWLAEQHQANEVHVEAGSELCGALLQLHLVDEIVIYMAPHIMGDSARGLFHLAELHTMAQRINLQINDIRAIGKDWRITAVPSYT